MFVESAHKYECGPPVVTHSSSDMPSSSSKSYTLDLADNGGDFGDGLARGVDKGVAFAAAFDLAVAYRVWLGSKLMRWN